MKRMIVPLLLVVLASARTAMADTSLGNVDLDFTGFLGPHVNVYYSTNYVPGPASYTYTNPNAGPYQFSLSPGSAPSALAGSIGPLNGFCIDLVQDISLGNYPSAFQLYSVTNSANNDLLVTENGVTPQTATTNILKLFNLYAAAPYNGSLNNPQPSDLSTALTLAIWDVLLDPNAGTSTHIAIESSTNPLYETGADSTVVSDADALLNALPSAAVTGSFYAVVDTNGAQAQEFISLSPLPLAPEPPVFAGLFGLALLGVPYFFRGRRKATGNA